MSEYLIEDAYIATQNKNRDIVFGDIYIEDKYIKKIIRKNEKMVSQSTQRLVVPAFYNLHMHLGETIFRGRCDGLNLFEYLDISHHSYDNELWRSKELAIHTLSGYITLMEAIRNGCGVIMCNRGWEEVKQVGIEAFCAYPIVNIAKLKDYYHASKENLDHFFSMETSKYNKVIFLQSIYLADDNKVNEISSLMSRDKEIKLIVHVAETKREIDYVNEQYGCTSIEYLHRKGLLNSNVFCIHCVYLSDHDIELIKESNTNVVLCPVSNLKLQSGFPDVSKLHDSKINMSVATDGFATNNSASLLEELKILGIMTGCSIDSNDLFDMITVNPARAVNIEEHFGTIEENCAADLAIFEAPAYNFNDIGKIINQLIYNYNEFVCTDVIVNGTMLYQKGNYCGINKNKIYEDYYHLLKDLFK